MTRGSRTFVIAEAGVNHNGSLKMARELVEKAKMAGADAIKFQTFKADKLVSRNAGKADYQKKTTPSKESQYDMIRRLELGPQDHQDIIRHCTRKKITFLSSPFDEESVDLLDSLGVTCFKIPSGEITNFPFLEHVAKKGKPIILSTGMSNLAEIQEALDVIFRMGNRNVTLLHCVTEYPAPWDEINLRAMLTMKEAFKLPVGYSDHTLGTEIAIGAVALGAEVIEKHFTLDKNLDGPDHKASLEPEEFKQMVNAIRNLESSLGDGIKRAARCELRNMKVARKSIVAAVDIPGGEEITLRNVTIKRPGSGIQPKDLKKIMGLKARNKIRQDEVITWKKLV